LDAARREFTEEVGITSTPPFIELGSIRQRGGKTVFAWAFEGQWDSTQGIQSNCIDVEWPAGSGHWSSWPEIDRAGFFSPAAAKERMKLAQHPFIDRLADALARARYAQMSTA
jgi:predicted NUDIX family NTP pyrophosphohydrolase